MFGSNRFRQKKEEVNYRFEEKKILDSVLGPEVYDRRIRPSGLNSTGNITLAFGFFSRSPRCFIVLQYRVIQAWYE